ncbi:unnamed protein product [Pleuronectes platessa]|uniref:Uncharacterized protein n=1 Tax=Pleuronectes platessa TaxID=8262 RepID=A0A9N7Z3G4_PLEPL|nr:unnamed protein product [Pleuronectes platessa]
MVLTKIEVQLLTQLNRGRPPAVEREHRVSLRTRDDGTETRTSSPRSARVLLWKQTWGDLAISSTNEEFNELRAREQWESRGRDYKGQQYTNRRAPDSVEPATCETSQSRSTTPSTSLQELEDMARGRRREEAEENQRKSLKRPAPPPSISGGDPAPDSLLQGPS